MTFILPELDTSGGVRVVAIYAEGLLKRGHEVTVVAARPSPPTLREAARSIIKKRKWPFGKVGDRLHFKNSSVKVIETSHSGPLTDRDVPDADIVLATWWATAPWVYDLSASKGVKAHFFQAYEDWGGDPAQVRIATGLPLHKIVISKWMIDFFKNEFHQPAHWVPNSVDMNQFHAPPRGKQPVPTVGTVYHPMPHKGCVLAIEAFHLAKKEVPELKFLAMSTYQPVPELPLPEGTEFYHRPPQNQLREIYAKADAWLFASKSEGFGLPIIEAMACRTPVIGTATGAAPELIGAGGGVLIPIDDAPAMAREIVRFAQMSEERWKEFSDAAYRTVSEYTWDDATDRFEETLKKLVALGPMPSEK